MLDQHIYQEVTNQEMRLEWCEYCGATPGYYETHHIKSKGSGGSEIRANKINLCAECHDKAQQYKIKPEELIVIVARREKVTVAEVYTAIGIPIPDNIEELEAIAADSRTAMKTMEDLISMLIDTEQQTDEIRFLQGQIIDELTIRGAKYAWIASQVAKSAAWVRTAHKTFLAFPTMKDRIPSLSWTHHKIAAATDNPKKWIEIAADKEMSTRELRAAIIAEEEKDEELEESVEEIMQKKAEKTLEGIIEVFEVGGEPAEWLRSQLLNLLNELQKTA